MNSMRIIKQNIVTTWLLTFSTAFDPAFLVRTDRISRYCVHCIWWPTALERPAITTPRQQSSKRQWTVRFSVRCWTRKPWGKMTANFNNCWDHVSQRIKYLSIAVSQLLNLHKWGSTLQFCLNVSNKLQARQKHWSSSSSLSYSCPSLCLPAFSHFIILYNNNFFTSNWIIQNAWEPHSEMSSNDAIVILPCGQVLQILVPCTGSNETYWFGPINCRLNTPKLSSP